MKSHASLLIYALLLALLSTACSGGNSRQSGGYQAESSAAPLSAIIDGDTMIFNKLSDNSLQLALWKPAKGNASLNIPANVVIDSKGYTVTAVGPEALNNPAIGRRAVKLHIPATIDKIEGLDNFYPYGATFASISADVANTSFKVVDNVLYSAAGDSIYWATINQTRPVRLNITPALDITNAKLSRLRAEGQDVDTHIKNIAGVTLDPSHPSMMMIEGRLYNTRDGYMIFNFNHTPEIRMPNFCRGISAVLPIDFQKVTFDNAALGRDVFSCYQSMLAAYAGLPMKFVWLGGQRDIEPFDMGAIKMFSDLVLRMNPSHPEAQKLNAIILENMPD